MNHTHELVIDEMAKEIVHIHPELPQLHGTELTDKVFHTTHHTEHGQAAHDGPASVPALLMTSSPKSVGREELDDSGSNSCLAAGFCAKACLEFK